MLGLRFCARAFSSCGKRGPLFIAVRGPLTIAASLVAEYRLRTCRLSSCGSRAQLLRGMWDPPRLGLEPVSPALAGRFSTTAPPGKPGNRIFEDNIKFKWGHTWLRWALIQLCPYKKKRDTERPPCDNRGRDSSDGSTNQGTPKTASTPEAWRNAWKRFSPRTLRVIMILPTPWSRTPSLQNCERTDFCCF